MKSRKFTIVFFIFFLRFLCQVNCQNSNNIVINGRVGAITAGCGSSEFKIFDNNRKQISVGKTDNGGVFNFKLQYEKEYFILFQCAAYKKQYRLIYISTIGFHNLTGNKLELPTNIGAKDIAKSDTSELQFNEPTLFFYYSSKYKSIEFSTKRPTLELNKPINEEPTNIKGDLIKIRLLIRARKGENKFENCPSIHQGEVEFIHTHQWSSGFVKVAPINRSYNAELKLNCEEQYELTIDCPGFFKKSIYLTLYSLVHQLNCKQLQPDTLNILLDSCFINDRKPNYFGANYFYSGKGILERSNKLKSYEIESIKMYKEMVERAQNGRTEYYKENSFEGSNTINSTLEENPILNEEADQQTNEIPQNKSDNIETRTNTALSQMNSMDDGLPVIGKMPEAIFKNKPAQRLPTATQKKFEKFGFDTLKLYTERKVKQQIYQLEKSTQMLKTTQDTLSLFVQLYKINKDFIYIGKKRIEELSTDTGNRLLINEIKEGIDEKELENYFIKKEVSDLRFKLQNKTLELENATYAKNLLFIIAIFIAIISILLLRAYFIKRNSNTKLHKQNELIAEQKQEITDSIQYAQRIQFAILPTKETILKAFPQSFILFKPKDIVSGDFYWFQQVGDKKYIAACDCTGHGVPGALMSMVSTDMLNDSLVHHKEVNKIIENTNRSIKVALKQSEDDDTTRDGMDLALCCFDEKNNSLTYAGAYRPLWLIRHVKLDSASPRNAAQDRNGEWELIEYKGTKAAIGGLTEDDQAFQLNEIRLQKGDTIYLSTDGFADQFSPADKKLMTKRFKETLLGIQHLSMPEQENYLDKFITDWRGNMEQTDDVLVIGVRV